MSTKFVLKNCNPNEFKKDSIESVAKKERYDIIQPGKLTHTNNAGGTVRVLLRGELYYKNGSPYDENPVKPCFYCRRPFEHLAMGIPIRISYKNGERHIFMDGIYCSYSCTYKAILVDEEKLPQKRNPNYAPSKTLLLQLFNEEFPNDELIPAMDWEFQKDIGNGNLTQKEYASKLGGIRLKKNPNIIFHPVTVSYDILNARP